MGRTVQLQSSVSKIVSLVPSQTELLFELGLEKEVVGITKFCIHPKSWFSDKNKVGGTKTPRLKDIIDLNPDLIIANKEENDKKSLQELSERFPVWISDIKNLKDAYEMIISVGKITNKQPKANNIVSNIKKNFKKLQTTTSKKRVMYLIWNKPYMSVGHDTFIHHMLERCGFINVMENEKRYPVLSMEQIKLANPDLIFLSTEPFPFKKKHQKEFQSIFENTQVQIVDGEFFSWYGSRLIQAPVYLNDLLNLVDQGKTD